MSKILDFLSFIDVDNSEDEILFNDMRSGALNELTSAVETVIRERYRQDAKWGEQNHNPYIYLAILMEEVGELAQAVLETQFGGNHGGWDNVRKEASHCAAVAIAAIECLDRDKWKENDVHLRNK